MKKINICIKTIIIFFIFPSLANAQCPSGWALQGGSPKHFDIATTTAIDNFGNIYVAGKYMDTAVFSGQTLISTSSEDIFLAKYDVNGNLIWIKSVGGSNTDEPASIAIDNNYNIYMTGVNFGIAVFDTITLNNNSGYPNAFAAKFNSAGNVIWAIAIGNSDWDEGGGIAVHNNYLYLSGTFSLSVTMGTTTLTSFGQKDLYLAKLDLNGNYIWANSFGSAQSDWARKLAVDLGGNIYVTGNFSANITIGSTTLINQGSYDMILAKYDGNGNFLWAKSAGGGYDDSGTGIALDSVNNIYVSLSASSGCMFGTITVNNYGDKDIILAKYDSSGKVIWARNSGGIDRDLGGGIAVANNNTIYQTGSFNGIATFDTVMFNLSGYDYIFLAEYDSSGNINFVKYAGGSEQDFGKSLECFNNNVFVCGKFENTTSFDLTTLTADSNGGNAFIWKACNGVVGINEPSEFFESYFYPNPFKDKINIDILNNQIIQIVIMDITSRKILQQNFTNSISLNTEHMPKGVYIYELRNKNGIVQNGKILKE